MLYNFSEFLTTVKEDLEISDIPLPVDDTQLTDRFRRSALKEFSVRYPNLVFIRIDQKNMIDDSMRQINGSVTYRIPKTGYEDTNIVSVVGLDPGGWSNFGNDMMYMPMMNFTSPDAMLGSIADIQMAAAMGSTLGKAPTFQFIAPDKVVIYHAWYGGNYLLEVAFEHDLSLSTVPPGAIPALRHLTVLDFKAYLYSLLKRKDNLELGVGTINLKIDDWASAKDDMKSLLESWDNEGANLDFDTINYY